MTNMTDQIRKAFEEVTYLTLRATGHGLRRRPDGQYVSDTLEDHWQTFQEGWEEAIKYLQSKNNPCYSDIISDGGMDPRK
jgi:1,2-phenylacetyl-CoA epoxidase catalytic subunit